MNFGRDNRPQERHRPDVTLEGAILLTHLSLLHGLSSLLPDRLNLRDVLPQLYEVMRDESADFYVLAHRMRACK